MFRTGLASSSSVLQQAAGSRWCRVVVLAMVGWVAGLSAINAANAKGPAEGPAATVALSTLPPQAQEMQRLVLSGGPFRYPKDGIVFSNRERRLPRQSRGYYREYTVKTPGARDRGARRIVCGGEPVTRPEVCYYTDDHYASFRRIVQ